VRVERRPALDGHRNGGEQDARRCSDQLQTRSAAVVGSPGIFAPYLRGDREHDENQQGCSCKLAAPNENLAQRRE